MTVVRGFAIVIASAIGFGVAGGSVGYALGRLAPSYYRAVFSRGEPVFEPVEVGLGLGVSEGLIAGLVVGCVVVLAVAISNSRRLTKIALDEV